MHSHRILAPRLDFERRDDCVSCDSTTPVCNCATGEKCVLTSRTCNQCAAIQCIKGSSSSSSSSVNAGVIAGPVVAVLVIASLGLFWWLRRKKRRDLARVEELADRARKAESAGFQLSHPGSPAPGSARSRSTNSRNSSLPLPPPSAARSGGSRSPLPPAPVNAEYYDENGATIRVYSGNGGTIHADSRGAGGAGGADPFSDRQSISTMGSGGTANIIPIQWIPPSKSEDALSRVAGGQPAAQAQGGQTAAARALDEARQNLFKPKRPARSPDMDLRLNPTTGISTAPSSFDPGALRSPADAAGWRDSYLSGNSAAPSYWSGQSDVHLDAPKIVTSKQVQIGRYQQAEMVQFGGKSPQIVEMLGKGKLSPVRDEENPFNSLSSVASSSYARHPAERGEEPAPGLSPSNASFQSGEATVRSLTPRSARFGEEERLGAAGGEGAGGDGESGDLRFSMGSLAYRDSVSTMGTGRYLASAITTGLPAPAGNAGAAPAGRERESVLSSKSFADSVLGAFPMIPPDSHHARPPLPPNAEAIARERSESFSLGLPPRAPGGPAGQGRGASVPHSTSIDTLEHVARPPPTAVARPPPPGPRPASSVRGSTAEDAGAGAGEAGAGKKRPETQASIADSFLGTFPFVPPNVDDLAEMPQGVGQGQGR
ncbi:hypothetical protein IAT38_007115 [Cryptococcus sp. DSM 104549]